MSARALQLMLPIVELEGALVEVVIVGDRARVRPVGSSGWVKFPRALREPGARYRVERLKLRPGGAWTAVGHIQRVR